MAGALHVESQNAGTSSFPLPLQCHLEDTCKPNIDVPSFAELTGSSFAIHVSSMG